MPADFQSKFSVDRFPDWEDLNIAEVSRMMIRKTLRGQALYASMVYQGFEFLAEKHQTDLVFLYCSTWLSPSLPPAGLSSLWRRGGWRAADGPLGDRDVGCRALQEDRCHRKERLYASLWQGQESAP